MSRKVNEGIVKKVVFYGNHVEYSIDTPTQTIAAVVSDPVYDEIVPVGAVAKIDFDESRAWLLPSDSAVITSEK